MAEPCLTCNEEYELMRETQARIKAGVRTSQIAQSLVRDSTLNRTTEFQYFTTPAPTPREPVVEEVVAPVEPARDAPRKEWVQYVLALGNPESVLKGKTRDDLVKDYAT